MRLAGCFFGLTTMVLIPAAMDLSEELREASRRQGLALVEVSGWRVEIDPFGSKEIVRKSTHAPDPAWFAPDGKHVLWATNSGLILETLAGQVVATLSGVYGGHSVAISPDLKMVAFDAATKSETEYALSYADFQSGIVHKIWPEPESDLRHIASGSLGWSPDSSRLVFGRAGKIFVYDIKSATKATICEGWNPSWSPNDEWIGFMSPEGEGVLITPDGRSRRSLTPGRKILKSIHWSPDSQYLLYSEKAPPPKRSPRYGTGIASQLVVYRLRDGATKVVREFGHLGGTDAYYAWIYDYTVLSARLPVP